MYALMNDQWAGSSLHATVARRRWAVGAHIVLSALIVAAWMRSAFTQKLWQVFVMGGLLLPWCLVTGVINGATRGLLELRGHILDERQLAERDRAYARAHKVVSSLLAVAVLAAATAGWISDISLESLLLPTWYPSSSHTG